MRPPVGPARRWIHVVPAQGIGGLDQVDRASGALGEDGAEGPLDHASRGRAEGEEVRIDLSAEMDLVGREHLIVLPEGEPIRGRVVLRTDADQAAGLRDRHERGTVIGEVEHPISDRTGLVDMDRLRMMQGEALDRCR